MAATRLAIVVAAAALAGCQSSGDVPSEAPVEAAGAAVAGDSARVREQVHIMLSEHCGECHHHDSPGAVAGALAIFDLDEPDWHAGLTTAERLEGARRRLVDVLGETDRGTFESFAADQRSR